MKNFGFSYIGSWTIVKLNVKLDVLQRVQLNSFYKDSLFIREIGKGLTRIEGCIKTSVLSDFTYNLERAKLMSKISAMQNRLDNLVHPFAPSEQENEFNWENCSI